MFEQSRAVILSISLLAAFTLYAPASVASTLGEDASQEFQDEGFGWLLSPEVLGTLEDLPGRKDPASLEMVAQLFRARDERAALALQNYMDRYPSDPAAFDIAGTDLLRQGEFQNAVLAFNRAVELAPLVPWLQAKLGVSQVLAGKKDEGVETLQGVIALQPNNPLARRYLAWVALEEGNLPQAIVHSERALLAFGIPKGTVNRAHLDLARLYRDAGRYTSIIVLLNPAVKNSEFSASRQFAIEMYGFYLDAALQLRDSNSAHIALTRMRRLGAAEAPAYKIAAARVDLLDGKPDQAISKLKKIREAHPEFQLALIPDLAVAEASAGKIDSAVDRLTSLAGVSDEGQDLPHLRNAAKIVLDNKGAEAAVEFAEINLLSKDRADLSYLAAEISTQANDVDGAHKILTEVTAEWPDFAPAHWLLGTIQLDQGMKEEARASLERSVELEPNNPGRWLSLIGAVHGHETYAHSDANAGHDEVEAILERAIQANPDSAVLYSEKGLLFLSNGDIEKAIVEFDHAVESSAGYLPALTLGALARADAGIEFEVAERYIFLSRQIAPEDAIAADVEGWIAYKSGDKDKARVLLDNSLDMSPDDTTTQYHRAVISEEDGELDRARELYLSSLSGADMYVHYVADARAGLERITPSEELTVSVFRLTSEGKGDEMGSIRISATGDGLQLDADVTGLPSGPNAVHIHVHPTCAPKDEKAGGAAGEHFGHDEHMHHQVDNASNSGDASMPSMKPRGDLDPFTADDNGVAQVTVTSDRLMLTEIRGRSLMIHEGPDVDGKSGPKFACAIIH